MRITKLEYLEMFLKARIKNSSEESFTHYKENHMKPKSELDNLILHIRRVRNFLENCRAFKSLGSCLIKFLGDVTPLFYEN